MESILLLDDDAGFRKGLETILAGQRYAVEGAGTLRDGIAAAEHRHFDLLLASARLPDANGAAVLRWLAVNAPGTPAILIVPPDAIPALIEALRLGVDGCLAKTFESPAELLALVRRALDHGVEARERALLRENERARFNDYALVARDLKTLEAMEKAGGFSAMDSPLLIQGECGTGKELLARWLHFAGPRAARPFVPVDCCAQPARSFEPGGRIEGAHLGTLFLDEVGALDAARQLRLLRLLRDGILEVGPTARATAVDTRVIASTCRDLKRLAAEGKFREDLCERLGAATVTVPPLRERRADIVTLARFFLLRSTRELRKPELLLTQGAEAALQIYDWPGNLRELANVMERAALACRERVEAADVAVGMQSARERALLWKDIERQAIEEALRMNGGNRTRASKQLGISLRTLQYRLKAWNAAGQS